MNILFMNIINKEIKNYLLIIKNVILNNTKHVRDFTFFNSKYVIQYHFYFKQISNIKK